MAVCLTAFCALFLWPIFTEGVMTVKLPQPRTSRGKPLMQALNERKTSREFSSKELPAQLFSDLLWAAFGVNRSDGRRTAPSAMNMQEIEIYVAKQDGLYLYNAGANELDQVLPNDIRALTGRQTFVAEAPATLIYVADLSKMKKLSGDDINFYSAADTGFISENVYLFCASEGLSTGVRGSIDRARLSEAMRLGPDQKIILAQSVGYPK